MDFLQNLDVNGVINKVKNAVMNYTEYQAKVMDATNNDHWGASSTLMQDIAHGTGNPQHFMDIMETLYKKFSERGANWRQCYKALQLLEYLIKNGSERVVDNAKDHVYDLKALKNFHYVDDKGKDQGINVRNRANEIIELLSDVNKIRDERKKAKENRSKYTGVSSDSTRGGFAGSGSKYGGFGSDSFRSGGGGGGGGGGGNGFRDEDSDRGGKYDEPSSSNSRSGGGYDSYSSSSKSSAAAVTSSIDSNNNNNGSAKVQVVMKQPAAPQPDLLDMSGGGQQDDWGDFTAAGTGMKTKASPLDDFADFQAAVPSVSAQQPNTSFATFSPPSSQQQQSVQSQQFASFASFQPPRPQQTTPLSPPPVATNGFASFNSFTPIAPSTNTSSSSSNFGNFAAFSQSTASAVPAVKTGNNNDLFSSSLNGFSSSGGGGVGSVKPTNQVSSSPKKEDPFGKLVSLDPMSLSNGGKKGEAPSGPSLNAISSQQFQQQVQQQQQFSAFSSSASSVGMGGGGLMKPTMSVSPMTGNPPQSSNNSNNNDLLSLI